MPSNASPRPPRLLVIGAGSRGYGYARAVTEHTNAVIVAVAEPMVLKRRELGSKYIWKDSQPREGQEFESWQDFIKWERERRDKAGGKQEDSIDGAFVCTLDHTHREIVEALAALNLHVMCEKPLATTLDDCLRMQNALVPGGTAPKAVFAIGHVLRYSPHNMMLRRLVREEEAVGEVLSVEHTEPVGWWHFSHSFVRGNWRKESYTAPSLLTKSCHDIDWLLWMLCSSIDPSGAPHLPSTVQSAGQRTFFRRSRKPKAAGEATNCLSCPIERSCIYSAKQIYLDRHLVGMKDTGWPVKIVNPEIEECYETHGEAAAERKLLASLAEDWSSTTPAAHVESRPWFGRCVWECDNDVCDDQTVTVTWDEEGEKKQGEHQNGGTGDAVYAAAAAQQQSLKGRGAKNATLHMVAWTEAQCERRGRIYGTLGEVEYDSFVIKVHSFVTGETKSYNPKQEGGGHGGGDAGLTRQFVRAVEAVENQGASVDQAQVQHIGCTVQEAVRSHALVFAAEDARTGKKVVDWGDWWRQKVESWSP